MPALNYHHLRYFWAIAHERNLTRAAQRLHVSQSALSIQLRQLEERLGQKLFERSGKRLVLTEAGRIALDYADTIFRAGDELVGLLQGRSAAGRQPLRIGAVATLSRNFQFGLLQPLMARPASSWYCTRARCANCWRSLMHTLSIWCCRTSQFRAMPAGRGTAI